MKKIFYTTIALCTISVVCFAQASIATFQINKTNYLAFDNFYPNTNLEFYSQESGGKFLATHQVVSNNDVIANLSLPKLIVNKKSTMNTFGTNQVFMVDKQEFILQNITISAFDRTAIIAWQASTFENSIQFKLLKSTDGISYQEIALVSATNNNIENNYELADANNTNATYKIEVIKDNKLVRYTSNPLLMSTATGSANIYPTSTKAIVYADVSAVNIPYTITDMAGKKLLNNVLANYHNAIDLSAYKNGMYLIEIFVNNQKEIYKVIKE
jgi:hypothetical protein